MRVRLLLLIPMLLLLAAACGDDQGSPFGSHPDATTTTAAGVTTTTEAATTTAAGGEEALMGFFASELAAADSPFDQEAAECFARSIVDEIGSERLAALGALEPGADAESVFSQMSPEEIDSIADLGLSCVDMHALLVDEFTGQGIPEETAICLADGVAGTPFLHDMVIGAMMGETADPMADPESMTLIMNLMTQCMAG